MSNRGCEIGLGTERDCGVRIAPEPGVWRGRVKQSFARGGERAARFRRELGLAVDRPVVMTGHQAQVWHPGILAKYLAADAFVTRHGEGQCAWLVVEQDVNDPGLVRAPVRMAEAGVNGGGRLRVAEWEALRAAAGEGDVPVGRRAARAPSPVPTLLPGEQWAAASVGPGLARIAQALGRHGKAASLAEQTARAAAELCAAMMRTDHAAMVMSLSISRTALFAELVERMRRSPRVAVETYNAAVADHPHERTQMLGADEMPLWVIEGAGAPRRRAMVGDLSRPVEELSPRALLMTGMLRWAGCDLFIHGTGGGGAVGAGGAGGAGGMAGHGHEGYDRITEQWMRAWLGEEAVLAPAVVVTATLRLEIGYDGPTATDLRRRQWLRHRGRHDPAVIGDAAAAARKAGMIEEIRRARRAGEDARGLYKQMHAMLERVRDERAEELARLDMAAAAAAERLGDAQIAADRTWAFPLYSAEQLDALAGEIGRHFGRG